MSPLDRFVASRISIQGEILSFEGEILSIQGEILSIQGGYLSSGEFPLSLVTFYIQSVFQ